MSFRYSDSTDIIPRFDSPTGLGTWSHSWFCRFRLDRLLTGGEAKWIYQRIRMGANTSRLVEIFVQDLGGNTRVRFACGASNPGSNTLAVDLQIDVWYTLICVKDHAFTQNYIYLDGVKEVDIHNGNALVEATDAEDGIGGRPRYSEECFPGSIADFTWWNYSIRDEPIAQALHDGMSPLKYRYGNICWHNPMIDAPDSSGPVKDHSLYLRDAAWNGNGTTYPVAGDAAPRGLVFGFDLGRRAGGITVTLVTVPDVVGDTEAVATSTLQAAGFTVSPQDLSHPTAPVGTVFEQQPVGGAEAAEGSAVTISVSTGPAMVTVPDVVGDSESSATSTLQALGLVVQSVYGPHQTVAVNDVYDQQPRDGTSVEVGSTVVIFVSTGPAADDYKPRQDGPYAVSVPFSTAPGATGERQLGDCGLYCSVTPGEIPDSPFAKIQFPFSVAPAAEPT